VRRGLGDDLRTLYLLIVLLAILYPIIYSLRPGWEVILTYGVVLGIAALGFNLLLGYTGLLSFGHAAFFGLGAYAAAFLYKYLGVRSTEVYILGGIASSALISLLIGLIVVRYTRIFFSILTLAIAQVLWSLYIKFYWITGGSDGIKIPRPNILGFQTESMSFDAFQMLYHYYSLAIFAILAYIMWRIVNSPLGYALKAVRDNEARSRFVGLSIYRLRLYSLIISAIYCGIAGALYAPLNRLVTPDLAYWTFSGKIVFMTLLGGFKYFTGPIIGAIVYSYLESYAIGLTIYWQLILGSLIIVIMILARDGIIGAIDKLRSKYKYIAVRRINRGG